MKYLQYTAVIILLLGLVLNTGCRRELSDDAIEASFPKNGEVFIDGFSAGLEYLPFAGSYLEAFSVDNETFYEGTASMRLDIPNVNDPKGAFSGAIFPDNGGRDLTEFDALTFWAKASKAASVNEIGFGQDFGENRYQVVLNGLNLTTNWRRYMIAIPDPSKLTEEKGLFWYSEGPELGQGYSIWIDELQFETLGTIAQPRPAIWNGDDTELQTFIGVTTEIPGLTLTVNLGDGSDQTLGLEPAYFTFISSDSSVATVNEKGVITAISNGEAEVTATLNGVKAAGSVSVKVLGEFTHAPTPTQDPADVISIFSNAYEDEPVDYYNGFWEPFQTTLGGADLTIEGDDIISYSNLNFVGIQFATNVPTIDISQMTSFHVDFQVRDSIEPGDFIRFQLVDLGPDDDFGGEDGSVGDITVGAAELTRGEWLSIDVPLTSMPTLTTRANLAQIVTISDATISNIFVDNIYFHKGPGGGPTEPQNAAPTPTQDAEDVISVYSDAYTNIDANLNPDWGQGTEFSEVQIEGNNTMRYGGLNFQGIDFASSQNLSDMNFLHIDYWTSNSSSLNSFLISTGPVETGQVLDVPTTGWASVDIPLSGFDPVDIADVIQMKFDGNGDIYLDNIYFYKDGSGPTEPTVAAPTPTQDAADVISVFSDAYTNIDGTDLNPNWGQGTVVTEVQIEGNNTLRYGDLNFQGIQLGSAQDVSGMEFLHIDYWTANSDALSTFLISSGPVETASVMAVPTAGWGSVDVPLGDFDPVDLADVIQMKFEGNGDIYLDNIYFYKESSGPTEPTVAAPTPMQDAADVISVFSDAYTNIDGTDLNPNWGQATVVTEVQIEGNNTLRYGGLNFQGIQLGSAQDVSGMEFLHIDYWTANSDALSTFLISSGPVETASAMAVPTAGWGSVDIPLGDFDPVDLADVIQMKFEGNGDIYLDNIFFYKEGSGPSEPTVAAPAPTQDPADVISVFSDAYSNIDGTDLNPNWGQATVVTEVLIEGNNTLRYGNLNYQGVQLGSAQDVSGMEFLHIDYWTANSEALSTFLISTGPVETASVMAVPTSGWGSVDIALGDFDPVDLADVIQMKFEGNGDIYLDNIYFYREGSGPTEPTVAAPTPTEDAANVISVFSDAYTNIDGTDLNPNWGQATVVTEVPIEGNNTLRYGGLNFQGIQLGSAQDLSGMEFLHIDYWTVNSEALSTFLISSGPVETSSVMAVPTTGWGSVDIPLGDFDPVDLADVIQMKFEGNGDIYLDNIYFYTPGQTTEPELPLTFEDGVNPVIAFDGGATAAVIDNPDMNGNPSAKVLEFNKVMGSAWYSGIVFDDALRATPLIDLANGTVFTVRIWSPNANVPVRFQLEGGAAPAYEVFQTITEANQWVTLTFDFTDQVNASDTYPKFSLFPDFDPGNQEPVAEGAIYYIDDITQQ